MRGGSGKEGRRWRKRRGFLSMEKEEKKEDEKEKEELEEGKKMEVRTRIEQE